MNDDDGQLPMQGPTKGVCDGRKDQCSLSAGDGVCPLFGTLVKPARDGLRRVKGCGDPVARGKRNKQKGSRKQAAAARAVGVPVTSLHPGHEEWMRGEVRIEVKAGLKAKPIHTQYLASRAQSDASKAFGDNRPFVAIFMPDAVSYGYVVIRTDDLPAAAQALYTALCDNGIE